MRAFTHNINVRNVNDALEYSLRYLPYGSNREGSRNGEVMVSNTPVVTCYANPTERVLFSPLRDANPFFHLMESLWMLAGRDDVAFPVLFNSTFGQFSDDGERFWGAYGARWRKWFGYDQLELIIEELIRNPESRRCVLAMWSPGFTISTDERKAVQPDLLQALGGGKDVPCNTHIYFRVLMGDNGPQLDMMVNCRSNDIFWGAYGANAVHMSVLQEYLASSIGVGVGRYWQNSFNFHVYLQKFPEEKFKDYADDARHTNFYMDESVVPSPLMSSPRGLWDEELLMALTWAEGFMLDGACDHATFSDPFFERTVDPLVRAWYAHKEKDYPAAFHAAQRVASQDWRKASIMWLERRQRKFEERQNNVQ